MNSRVQTESATPKTKLTRLGLALLLAMLLAAVFTLATPARADADPITPLGWNVNYTAPGSGVVATIVVAPDATTVTKPMARFSQWSIDGTTWNTSDMTLNPNGTYYLYTPLSWMSFNDDIVLPDVKAAVTVDIDPTITNAGNDFMYCYAAGCTSLTSLGVPDTSNITTAGYAFMECYASDCTSLTSLGVPDTSNITSAGYAFMGNYAWGCTSLTSLGVPDTSKITTVGDFFMGNYAWGCTSLTSLDVPDTSNITSVGDYFMPSYAYDCTSLNTLTMTSAPGWLATHDISWGVPAAAATDASGLVAVVPAEHLADWKALTASFRTLALNWITDPANVIAADLLPSITTTSIASSTVGIPFERTLLASQPATVTSPITWSLDSGNLPAGLTLSADGVLSGTPSAAGTFSVTIIATNSVGSTPKAFSIVVSAPASLDGEVVTLSTALNPARKVDITGKSVANGAQAIIWDTTIGANQRFMLEEASDYPGFYFIRSVNSGKVLDIYGGKIADGSNIIQWEQKAAGYENQLWAMEPLPDGNYRISSKLDTSYVMDIYGNSDKAGNRIILWTANDNTNQRFAVVEVTAAAGLVEGGYLIQTFAPGSRSLDVYGGSGAQGGRIILWDAKPAGSNGNQQFGLQYVPETGYWFIYTESDMVLDVYGGSTSAGAQVIQWPLKATNNLNQQWAIVPKNAADLSQGYCIYAAQTGLSLDCYGGSGAQGSNVITWDFHGRANQVWSFELA